MRRVWNGSADPKSRQMRGAFHCKISQHKSERPAEIHKQIVTVYGNVMNRQNVKKWCRELSAGSSMTMMKCKKKSWRGSKGWRQTSMTRRYRSLVQDFINVWTMPATMLKNKVMYRQFIHRVSFVNYKSCTCLRPLYLYFPDTPRTIKSCVLRKP